LEIAILRFAEVQVNANYNVDLRQTSMRGSHQRLNAIFLKQAAFKGRSTVLDTSAIRPRVSYTLTALFKGKS
jgi:hypothetical protein